MDQNNENLNSQPESNHEIQKDIKMKFTKHLCDFYKKDLENDNQTIDKFKITKKQIGYLIDLIENKKNKAKNYYYYAKQYAVQLIGETKQLIERIYRKMSKFSHRANRKNV